MKRKIIITLIIIMAIILLVWINEETNGLIFALSLGTLVLYAVAVALSNAFISTPAKSVREENKEKT